MIGSLVSFYMYQINIVVVSAIYIIIALLFTLINIIHYYYLIQTSHFNLLANQVF